MNMSNHLPLAADVNTCGIKRAAVIGAGSMGGGIAAQFANAGIPVELLDIPGPKGELPDAPARNGIARQVKVGGFMHPDAAKLVRAGNTETDLDRLADVDWIIEAVVENLDIKQALYRDLDRVRKPGAIVSSNTSTIPRARLVSGMSAEFCADFVITHFFNPPRLMQLVELVKGDENNDAIIKKTRKAAKVILGKTVVDCHDTPAFIANRIGCYWIATAILEAQRLGVSIEEADAVNAALGVPRTGVFGLMDLIGIDLVPHVWGSLLSGLQETDAFQAEDLPSDPLLRAMIDQGRLGRKSKAGFFRIASDKSREVIDLATGEYRAEVPVKKVDLPGNGDMTPLLESDCKLGRYAWRVLSKVLAYSAENGSEIASDVGAIDTAIELGYAWKQGPFKLADRYGLAKIVERFAADGASVPALLTRARSGFYDTAGVPLACDGSRLPSAKGAQQGLRKAKSSKPRMFGNEAASVWDLGDGVAAFEIHTKMNSLSPSVFDVLEEALTRGGSDFGALVIGNDDPRAFSVGADLTFIADLVRKQNWQSLHHYIARGQDVFHCLKYASFPVVAAANGFALGGGCELMLHAHAIVAHAELNAGVPEIKVGLLPAWGGCTQILLRAQQPHRRAEGVVAATAAAFEMIFAGKNTSSALDARTTGLLRPEDTIAMNRGQLIELSKAKAVSLMASDGFGPDNGRLAVAGIDGKAEIMQNINSRVATGEITEVDAAIAEVIASVLTGSVNGEAAHSVTEEEMMWLERDALMLLASQRTTRDRIEQLLLTGKPLRN